MPPEGTNASTNLGGRMDHLPVIQGGALGILTVFSGWCLYAILKGWLIPRSWVEAMRTQDKVIEEDLRARLKDAKDAQETEREQKQLLLYEIGPTITKALGSLPRTEEEP